MTTYSIGLVLTIGCTDSLPEEQDSAALAPVVDRFTNGERLVIAHRGGRGIGPDHTIETFQAGLDLGTDVLELDVHTSSDGEVVVIHDDTVDRTTEGTGRVNDFTLAELQALDAGYTWSPDGGTSFPFRGKGQRIPTMAEVFEAFPDHWYVIEIKQADPPMVDPFLKILQTFGLEQRTIVASFSDEVIQAVRASETGVRTSFGEGEATEFALIDLSALATYDPPAEVLQLPPTALGGFEVINETLIDNARRFELPVHAFTINEREEMDRLLALGVDGLITDWPDRARAAIDALSE
ncbi:MAG: glycerophosphodiester phosphodiesterase [Myxococcota bacterium]